MIGERIKNIRKVLNKTQAEFAEKLDIKVLSISQYERNKNLPGYLILKKICCELNVNPRYLILGEDPIFDTSEN